MRNKTKIIKDGEEPGIWGFDGSSTNQAPGNNSDCVLQPVFMCPDPIRGGDNVLVLCEVQLTDFTPHPTNTRARAWRSAEKYADQEPVFGIEQEYTFLKDGYPLGWPRAASPHRRVRTTAVSAPPRSSVGRSWRRTRRPAWTPASRSRAPTPR